MDGNTTGEGEEDYGGFNAYMSNLRSSAGIVDGDEEADAEAAGFSSAADQGVTQIESVIYGVPYEDAYQLGTGFMATTNLQALSETALEKIEIEAPKSTDKVGTTKFTYSFISSKEDYEQKMGNNFSLGLTKAALGVSTSVQTTNKMKFGLTSTTLIIYYEEMETFYRSLALKDYKLTEDAMMAAEEEGSDAFREEYGDYFVAGYQYGGMYDAYITITTETSEQLDKVKLQLGAKLKTMAKVGSGDKAQEVLQTSADLQFSNETQEILKNNKAEITVQIKTIGAGNTTPTDIAIPNSKDISAMNKVVGELTKFRNNLARAFDPSNYVPVNVMMRRYRSLSGMRTLLDAYIPVPPAVTAQIKAFNRALLNMRGYYNVIGSLPNNKIDTSIQEEWNKKFYGIVDPIIAAGNSFYLNPSKIDAELPKVEELSKQLKAIGDRYTFYSMLVNAQEKEPKLKGSEVKNQPFGANGGSTGYKSFAVSAAVTEDIKEGEEKFTEKIETVNVGNKEWYPELDAGEGFINCWIGVLCKNPHDTNRDVIDSPAVGKRRSKFFFRTGYDRDCEWYINWQTMRFNRELYPFAGLK